MADELTSFKLLQAKKKPPFDGFYLNMAEEQGFEPWKGY